MVWQALNVAIFSVAFYLAVSSGHSIAAVVAGMFGVAQIAFLGCRIYLWRRGLVRGH